MVQTDAYKLVALDEPTIPWLLRTLNGMVIKLSLNPLLSAEVSSWHFNKLESVFSYCLLPKTDQTLLSFIRGVDRRLILQATVNKFIDVDRREEVPV